MRPCIATKLNGVYLFIYLLYFAPPMQNAVFRFWLGPIAMYTLLWLEPITFCSVIRCIHFFDCRCSWL